MLPADGEVLLAAARDCLRSPPGCHALAAEIVQSVRLDPLRIALSQEIRYTRLGGCP